MAALQVAVILWATARMLVNESYDKRRWSAASGLRVFWDWSSWRLLSILIVMRLGGAFSASKSLDLTLGSDLCCHKSVNPFDRSCFLSVEPIKDGLNEVV